MTFLIIDCGSRSKILAYGFIDYADRIDLGLELDL